MHWILFVVFIYGGAMFSQEDSLRNDQEKIRGMFKSLQLTPEQEKRMKAVFYDRREALRKRKEENRLFHESLEKKTQQELELILTPEQLKQLEINKSKRKEHRSHLRDKRFNQRTK